MLTTPIFLVTVSLDETMEDSMTLTLFPAPCTEWGVSAALGDIRQPGFQKRAAEMFFRAMLAGYVAGSPSHAIDQLPGSRLITFTEEEFLVQDVFVAPPGICSYGTTHMSYKGVPIWFMQYAGFYPDETLPCLKAALAKNYRAHVFNGGRGPKLFEYFDSDTGVRWRYENQCHDKSEGFLRFSGIEGITRGAHAVHCGLHTYSGRWIVSPG